VSFGALFGLLGLEYPLLREINTEHRKKPVKIPVTKLRINKT